jgi:hypothetical protein
MAAVIDVLTDAGFLCDKAALLGETIKETLCVYLHTLTHINLENLNVKKFGIIPYTGGSAHCKISVFTAKHTTEQKLTSLR